MASTLFNKIRPTADVPIVDEKQPTDAEATPASPSSIGRDSDSEDFTPDAQDGVKGIEATTKVWNKNHLILAYVM